uniref:Reverse transcriptase Ty1/copia-type domain-containing protein n=1 Tax=Lactuca sativa TaxID=4236 RepID=A0A9R1V4X7_LACSA|nr:hypothetical protein LSAT_V11C600325220 [Lactuca sativa]
MSGSDNYDLPNLLEQAFLMKMMSTFRQTEDVSGCASSVPEPRKSTRARKAMSFGSDFQVYILEGTRNETISQNQYCFNIEEDPKTFSKAMTSMDVHFWKDVTQVIESTDAIFDEERFTSIPRPRNMIHQPSSKSTTQAEDVSGGASFVPDPRKSTKARKAMSFGSDFQLHLVEGTRNETISQHQYCFNIEEDPKTFSEAMASRDVHFWKEAIHDEIDSIMHNNTWVLADLPPGCKALGSIHNLVIHQMDVKTAFLNGDLDEEIYMKQPEGFVMLGNEHKVCKLKKSLYDDMLIFGTDLEEVDKTKKFLSSSFDMKDMREAEVVLGIRIRKGNNGISISQSHCIVKILIKFNFENCSPVSTPIDPSLKLLPNNGSPVSQLEHSMAIGCLMYAMIGTRPDIAYVVRRLSRYTSNPSLHHWQAVSIVFKYLKGNTNYGLTYSGYPFVLEESEFVGLSAAGKEADWLRNLIYEIPLWPKPISTISIRCDSAATLAKAYSQVYNGKSRHLGVRHSMILELIMTGVIPVEFVRTPFYLADHLTKGLARDLMHKAAVGMGLKST